MIFKTLQVFVLATVSIFCFSQESEKEIGRNIVSLYLGAAKLHENKELQIYVNSLGVYLARVADASESYDWQFGVMSDDGINAFAAPGGYILITKGLFDLLETEDELAFVLSHEINHVIKRHHIQVIENQERMAGVILEMQENLITENTLLPNMNSLFKDLALKGLDKNAEYESDLAGLELSVKAGYSSSAAFDVLFRFLGAQESITEELFFKTHPAPSERIDVLSQHITVEYEPLERYSNNSKRILDYK